MKKVIVFLAEGFEEVEAVTPIDFLRRADVEVITVGIGSKIIEGAHGIKVTSDTVLTEIDDVFLESVDAIIFPGGMPGAENLVKEERIIEIINSFNSCKKIIAAICASPGVILSKTNALKYKTATCYPGFEERFSKITSFSDSSVVVDGNVITSRAPGTAAEFSFVLIKALAGLKIAESIKKATLQPS